jgi:hypothetical protein
MQTNDRSLKAIRKHETVAGSESMKPFRRHSWLYLKLSACLWLTGRTETTMYVMSTLSILLPPLSME